MGGMARSLLVRTRFRPPPARVRVRAGRGRARQPKNRDITVTLEGGGVRLEIRPGFQTSKQTETLLSPDPNPSGFNDTAGR